VPPSERFPLTHRDGRRPRVLHRRLGKSHAHIGPERLRYGLASCLTSFPRAMLIMAAAFGLWRARLMSNSLFAVGVAAVVLVLLGGTTWLSGGFWAPDGVYSRFVSPAVGLGVGHGRERGALDPKSCYTCWW